MQEIIVIISFVIAVIIAVKNFVNSILVEYDIKNGMKIKDAVEKRKFRLRKLIKKRKEKRTEENLCQKSE